MLHHQTTLLSSTRRRRRIAAAHASHQRPRSAPWAAVVEVAGSSLAGAIASPLRGSGELDAASVGVSRDHPVASFRRSLDTPEPPAFRTLVNAWRNSLRSYCTESPPSMGGAFEREWGAARSRFNADGLATVYAFVRAGALGTSGALDVVPGERPLSAPRFARKPRIRVGQHPDRGTNPEAREGRRLSSGRPCGREGRGVFALENKHPDLTN